MTFKERVLLIPKSSAVIVFSISVLVMISWLISQGSPPDILRHIKFNTAFCLAMTSVSIWLMKDPPRKGNGKLISLAQCLSSLTVVIAGATFFQYLFGIDIGLDEIIISDKGAYSQKSLAGRMSPPTSISLILLNFGLIILDHKPKRWKRIGASTFLIPAIILPIFAIIGYMYGEDALYQYLPDIRMALITSVCLLILAIGALFCRPGEGALKVLTSEMIGGIGVRRLVPVVFLLPMILGYLVLLVIHKGYLDFQLGFALLIGSLIILLMSIIVFAGKKLDGLDLERLRLIQAREELLSIASHELKTPITSMLLQTQLMQKVLKRENGDERTKKYVNQVETQVVKLNRLIEDMLDLSRIRTGKFILTKEQIDMCEMVREVIGRLKPLFEKSGSGSPQIDSCQHTSGTWDRIRIEQVLNNLFTNSIRYGGGKPIHVKITDQGSSVQISVKDSGIGIPAEKQDKIFDRFERVGMIKESSGLGLGLYITKQIVVAHAGKIWVESTVGAGSTFHVELPKNDSSTQGVLESLPKQTRET